MVGLAQPPYIGIACPGPNVTTCGRVGIGIWLTRPATGVEVTVRGVTVRLRAGGFGGPGPRYWQGYVRLQPGRYGLPPVWYGDRPALWLRLRLVVHRRAATLRGAVRARLHAGFG